MTTNSDDKLEKIQPLGNGKYYIHFNEKEVEIEGRKSYNYDTVIVDSCDRTTIINAIISLRYTTSDEIKLLYRGTIEQIAEHENWVRFAKSIVDEMDINNITLNPSISERLEQTEKATGEIIEVLNEKNIL